MGYRKKLELDILKDILKSKDGVYVYKLPPRYKISSQTMFVILRKYRKYIEYTEGKVRVIPGQEKELEGKCFFRTLEDEKNGILIPSCYIGRQIGIDDFYCPRQFRDQEELAF